MLKMRVKMAVGEVLEFAYYKMLKMNVVSDGDETNDIFTKWPPNANMVIYITDCELCEQLEAGGDFYVDFTKIKTG